MIPAPAILVVGDDERGVRPVRTTLHCFHQIGDVLLSAQQIGVPWMLVVFADGLDERNGRELAGLYVLDEILLVFQVRGFAAVPSA